jgi:formylglycine-generating enzyme required for sulfatase activity
MSTVVPGGDFLVRSLPLPGGNASQTGLDGGYPVHVEAFALDVYPVTVARFRAFVNAYDGISAPAAGSGENPAVPGTGWRDAWSANLPKTASDLRLGLASCPGTWTDQPGDSEQKAVSCLTWFEAFAFCVWDGGRLPTGSEWEFAAAGGSELRTYPWGESPPTDAVAETSCPGVAADDPPVGARPAGAGRWGHVDLTGGFLHQLVFDCDFTAKYPSLPCLDGAQCTCLGVSPTFASNRAVRGGGCAAGARVADSQVGSDVTTRWSSRGVRCARSPY